MPVTVYPVGRQTDVLVVCAAHRLRAPLRAQLIEDGYDVTALESWDEAELLLRSRAVRPRVIVIDVEEESNPEAALTTLVRLARDAPVLVLTAPSVLPAADVRRLGFSHARARPFRLGDVESEVKELLRARQ